MNGSEPTIHAEALDSELIARILSIIWARLRSTSARFDRVSARLPPVSRWIARVITKNWNSAVPRRSAVSCSATSIVRPIFILSETMRNSMPTGPPTSLATIPRVSVIGRPERRPRTISSIASGKFELNFLMRRWIILPIMKCGPPTPKNRPSSSDGRIGAPRSIPRPATTREMVRQIVAYLPSVISLPVISSRLRIKAGLGIRDEAKPSIPPTRWAISLRICAWALPATMSPWRSFTSSMRRFSAFDADGPRTARTASTSAPKPPIRMIHKSMSCLCLSLARPGEPRPPDWLRRLGRLRLRQHRLQIIDQVLGARRGLGFRGGSPVLGGIAEHHRRQLVERRGHLAAGDFGHWLAELGGLGG